MVVSATPFKAYEEVRDPALLPSVRAPAATPFCLSGEEREWGIWLIVCEKS